MTCSKCGASYLAGTGPCPRCGNETQTVYPSQERTCEECGGLLRESDGGCPQCEQRAARKAVKKAKTAKGFRVFLSVVLACLFATAFVATAVLGVVRDVTSEENIGTIAQAIDWASVIELAPAEDKGMIYQYISSTLNSKIDDGVLEEFLAQPASQAFLTQKLIEVLDGIREQRDVTITTEEITTLLVDNDAFFKEHLKVGLPKFIAKSIAALVTVGGEPVLAVSTMKEDSPLVYWLLYLSASDDMMTLFLAALAVITTVMLCFSFSRGFLSIGIVATVFGLLSTVAIALANAGILQTLIPVQPAGAIASAVVIGYWTPAWIILGGGIALLLLCGVYRSAYRRKTT